MFLTHLDTRVIEGGKFRLLAELHYLAAINHFFDYLIRVPIGFETDFASIPRGLRWLISQNERHRKAAALHDFLYDRQGEMGSLFMLSREQCDRIFLDAMKDCQVPIWKRNLMFWGVRIGGWKRWNQNSKNS